jgi:hypothetical protein
VGKTEKKRLFGRKLPGSGRDDRERLDFTDYAPDPVLEDEFYGGFHETDSDDERPAPNPKGAPPPIAGCEWRYLDGWGWGLFSQKRSLGSRPLYAKFLFALRIEERGFARYRQRSPGWAAERPTNGAHPFIIQAVRQVEQWLPEVSPGRDAAEDLDRQLRRPDDRPFTPHGILHEERAWFYAQHTQRRIQALLYRGYRPSKKLELKRFPVLKRIKSNPLLTKDYLARGLRSVKDARRTERELLVARFLAEGGKVRVCPPEKTAAQVKKVAPKIGRPSICDRPLTQVERKRRSRPLENRRGRKPAGLIAMTSAERVRKHRRAKRLRALVALERPPTGAGQPSPRGRPAPVNLSKEKKIT